MKKANDLTVTEVAEELALHPDTVKRLLRLGALPGYKADLKQWRVTRAGLDGYKAGGGAQRPGRPRNIAQAMDDNVTVGNEKARST